MKRRYLLLALISLSTCGFLGGCLRELLFVTAPLVI